MYGGEKSDRAIVAMKPANKAERLAAESVERRARAKGNAIQRYTRVGHSADIGVPIVGLHAGRRSAITQGGSRMRESRTYGSGAARLVAIPAGASPANRGVQSLL